MSTYTPISTQTLSSAAASVTFSGIPQTYTDLVLVVGSAGITASDFIVRMQINGDTGNNYSFTELYGNGTSALSTRDSNRGNIPIAYNVGMANDNNGNIVVNFMNYANTTTNKTVLVRENRAAAGTGTMVGLWRNTAAINSIKIESGGSANWTSGSTFTLYGIGAGSPKAFGGDVVVKDSTYWYHVYRSSGTFSPAQNLSCDVLVIAGGGGGGENNGGGGAGGLLNFSSQSLTTANYTVTIGAGGAGKAAASGLAGDNGTDSQFGSLTLVKGGGGGGSNTTGGKNGGSGGGAASAGTAVGTAESGQGNNGGAGTYNSGNYPGGGGGGAGAVGGSAPNDTTAGSGGAGSNAYSSWATATSTGVGGFYAGGGGGGTYNGGTTGTGGSGGGAAATANGTANTGGGGGGGTRLPNVGSGNGGSGIVIVRYLV